jgi:serine protease Do
MKTTILFLLALLTAGPALAQLDIPLLRPEEKEAVDTQADEFNAALTPILATAARSTVRVWSGKARLAYGTVVGDGRTVLTKYSEVARSPGRLIVETGDRSTREASVTGVYQQQDIAVLTLTGEPLAPITWHPAALRLGAFLTAPQPTGKPAAFGVVSVLERSLREVDKAFLGVGNDMTFPGPGVKVSMVTEDSGAAAAGLKAGDIILRMNDREISGLMEMRGILKDLAPNSKVMMQIDRKGQLHTLEAVLGNRPDLPGQFNRRLQTMERMGTDLSRVRGDFPNAIQSDMRPNPNQIGGPVVDLQGRAVGLTIARADRTRSFVMPAAAVMELLATEPINPGVARRVPESDPLQALGMAPRRGAPPPPGLVPADPERLNRHLMDMQRLMDTMREEKSRMDRRNR